MTSTPRPWHAMRWPTTSSGRRRAVVIAAVLMVALVLVAWTLLPPGTGVIGLLLVVGTCALLALLLLARSVVSRTGPATLALLEHINDLGSHHPAESEHLHREVAVAESPRAEESPSRPGVTELRVRVLEQALEEQSQRVRELLADRPGMGPDEAGRARPAIAVRALRQRLAEVPGDVATDRLATALDRLVVTAGLERITLAAAVGAPTGPSVAGPSADTVSDPSPDLLADLPPEPSPDPSPAAPLGPITELDEVHQDAPAFVEPEVVLPVPRPATPHPPQRKRRGLRRHVRV